MDQNRAPHPCDGLSIGDWVWWCHHEVPLERLTEPGRVRVNYIYSSKPAHERAVRLAAFRPVKDWAWAAPAQKAHDEACVPARKAYDEAYATAQKAYGEAYATAWKAYGEACATAQKAYGEVCAPAWKAILDKFHDEYPTFVEYDAKTQRLTFGEWTNEK